MSAVKKLPTSCPSRIPKERQACWISPEVIFTRITSWVSSLVWFSVRFFTWLLTCSSRSGRNSSPSVSISVSGPSTNGLSSKSPFFPTFTCDQRMTISGSRHSRMLSYGICPSWLVILFKMTMPSAWPYSSTINQEFRGLAISFPFIFGRGSRRTSFSILSRNEPFCMYWKVPEQRGKANSPAIC